MVLCSTVGDFQLPDLIRTHPAITADRVSFTSATHEYGCLMLETFVGNTRMLHMSTGRYTHVGETSCTEQIADMFSSSHAVTSLSIGLSFHRGAEPRRPLEQLPFRHVPILQEKRRDSCTLHAATHRWRISVSQAALLEDPVADAVPTPWI